MTSYRKRHIFRKTKNYADANKFCINKIRNPTKGGSKETVMDNCIELGGKLTLEEFIRIVRGHVPVRFSGKYRERVNRSRELVEQWTAEERVMYGVTTGFGALCTKTISKEEAAQLQRNILLSHSVSVGEPLPEEAVRGTMLMVLQNLGQGYSGVRLELLEMYREFLNRDLTPWAPGDGSVGYLCPEAHMALVLLGEGKATWKGELLDGREALKRAGLAPITLASKEGLALISGTTSVTAMGAIAVYDMIQAAKSADVIGACSLENCRGLLAAFDERVMSVRPHPEQKGCAENVRTVLAGSKVIENAKTSHLQDALSLRCIPQLHGAVKKTLYDAKRTIETEMNSCCDNPTIWPEAGAEDVISACNCDSSYVGLEMDSCSIAAVMLAKMSERRNNRMIDGNMSGLPAFLIRNPGLNSGLMVPQYTQAGLINRMRVLAYPASVDNTPTCMNQEDYVAMGYTAARKACEMVQKLEYVLAIELLTDYEAQAFREPAETIAAVTEAVYRRIEERVPVLKEDEFLYPHIEFLRQMIHSGELLRITEAITGPLQ